MIVLKRLEINSNLNADINNASLMQHYGSKKPSLSGFPPLLLAQNYHCASLSLIEHQGSTYFVRF